MWVPKIGNFNLKKSGAKREGESNVAFFLVPKCLTQTILKFYSGWLQAHHVPHMHFKYSILLHICSQAQDENAPHLIQQDHSVFNTIFEAEWCMHACRSISRDGIVTPSTALPEGDWKDFLTINDPTFSLWTQSFCHVSQHVLFRHTLGV